MVDLKLEAYAAEFIGTFFLVFTVGVNTLQNSALAPVSIGAILMAMIFAQGSVSGAHYNPAVTLGVLLSERGQTIWQDAVAYMVVQLLGGCVAAFMYSTILGATFTLHPGEGYGDLDAVVVEILFSTALIFVVLNVATTKQDTNNHYFGLAIGFLVMAAAFAIGPISGCSLNPAVTLGVMLTHWIRTGTGLRYLPHYLCSPLVGSILAVLAFWLTRSAEYMAHRHMRSVVPPPSEVEEEEESARGLAG